MTPIRACPLPADALLHASVANGGYADCFVADIAQVVSQAQFVEAFYTSAVFAVERWILRWAVSRPSTDAQARQLATGAIDAYAAWTVEARAVNQLLLTDITGRTRSWLMVLPVQLGSHAGTRLHFGSAVMPVGRAGKGPARMGWVFRALLGFHKRYSRVLLGAARARLRRHAS